MSFASLADLDDLIQITNSSGSEGSEELLLATSVSRDVLTLKLIPSSGPYFSGSWGELVLQRELKEQWRRASKERDFVSVSLAILKQCITTARLQVQSWPPRAESVILAFQPPQSQGLPNFKLTLTPSKEEDKDIRQSLFSLAVTSVKQGRQQIKALKESSNSEMDSVQKELSVARRKIASLQQDLAACQEPSASAVQGSPSSTQQGPRTASTPTSSPSKPVNLHKGPLDFGRTGRRTIKHSKDFESDSSEGSTKEESAPSKKPRK